MTITAEPATAEQLVRLAALILGPHGNAEHLVAGVRARDQTEAEWHRFAGVVTHEQWLYTLTVRECRTWLSGYAPSEVWARAREAEHHWDEPGHAVDLATLRTALTSAATVDRALAHLPDPDRVAVLLCDGFGMTVHECETVCRTPHEVTIMHLRRGRKTLLETLSADTARLPCRRAECGADHDQVFAEAEGAADPAAVAAHCTACSVCATLRAALHLLREALAAHQPTPRH